MKGVYYRVGAYQGHTVDQMTRIDGGSLIITNKRLIFVGRIKSMDIDLRKVLTIEPYSNAIMITASNRSKPVLFEGLDHATLTITVQGRESKEKLSGLIIKNLIEGQSRLLS